MRIITKEQMQKVYSMSKAVDSTDKAFKAYSNGESQTPLRVNIPTEHGSTLFMPAAAGESCGIKIVAVRPKNAEKKLPTVPAVYIDIDEETGFPKSMIDGQLLTYYRTGAASGVAIRHLAKKECHTLLVIGTGFQGTAGAEAALTQRAFKKVIGIDGYEPSLQKFKQFMESKNIECEVHLIDKVNSFVPEADVIITTTTSSVPVFDGSLVKEGCLVSGVGSYQPTTRELDSQLIKRSKVVVDTRVGALAESGDLLIPIQEQNLVKESVVEIGEIANGKAVGRQNDKEIITFKTVGSAIQDIVVGHEICTLCEENNLGSVVDM
uniref:Ornithine cyclodeaminase n=1 Tax=Trepomonas sp. PC1 TaxID=1076344 RepID=A0A146KC90_9EUKA|eukprot:JAP93126.1 Ornithine cyclodeaminase [Trepomonas sp. PC1]